MFIHDIIKINYISQGYLPNCPYHMTTDKAMIDAFLAEDGFFAVNYPCLDESFRDAYVTLLDAIASHLDAYLEDGTAIPNWVYAYMTMQTISINSDERDISELYILTNLDVPDVATFGPEIAQQCLEISTEWVKKLSATSDDRPPTMFGEPHVIKSLRLDDADVWVD